MEPLQAVTAVFVVLALGATLYWLRTRGVVSLKVAAGGQRQLQSIERLPLTPQHSLHLIRVAGRTVLIGVSPGGCSVLDRGDFEEGGNKL